MLCCKFFRNMVKYVGRIFYMQHFLSPWILAVISIAALVSGRLEVLIIVLGVELCSQSLHESRHHPDGWLANLLFRIIGIVIAGIGAWFLRSWHVTI